MAKGNPKSGDKSKTKKPDSIVDKDDTSREELPADLAALKVTLEKLEQVRSEIVIPEKEPVPVVPVKMKKLKPASERNKQPVLVAKVADPDAPVRERSMMQRTGKPQYNLSGQFMRHSILGEETDFFEEERRRADDPNEVRPPGRTKVEAMTASYRGGAEMKALSTANVYNEDAAAIEHWHRRLEERNIYRNLLRAKVGRPKEQLLMDIGDGARQRREVVDQIDRNLAFVDHGKGYRVGSEFWSQPQWIGTEDTGVQYTLTATQKGYPPVFEHTGIPRDIQTEKGYVHIPPGRRGWQDSEFLQKRLQQLQQIIHEVDPKKPSQQDVDDLIVRGQNADSLSKNSQLASRMNVSKTDDRFSSGARVQLVSVESARTENLPDDFYQNYDKEGEGGGLRSEEMFIDEKHKSSTSAIKYVNGPALKVGGVPAVWEKDDCSRVGEIGASCRVIFDGSQGEQMTSWLEIINYGSTVVRFNWTREKRYNPFDKPTDVSQQKFYFNTGPSVILPRQKILFPFVFKSDVAGIFTENWQMNTAPKLCGGAKIIVSLKGVALLVDKYKPVREEISAMLERRKAESVAKNLLLNIVDALHTSRPPPTPVDALLTDEEKFERLNPGLTGGVNEKLVDLANFYRDLFPEEERERVEWDLDLNSIRNKLLAIEDEKQREKLFKKFNENVYKLTVSIDRPSFSNDQQLYHLVYSNLSRICDGIVSASMSLRNSLGLSDVEFLMPPETYEKPLGYAIKQREREEQKRRQKAQEGTDKKDAKKGAAAGAKDKKGGAKDAGRPASKGATSPKKEEIKSNKRLSATSGASQTADANQTDDKAGLGAAERSRTMTSTELGEVEEDDFVHVKYRERMHLLVRELMGDTLVELLHAYDDVKLRHPWKPNLPKA